MSNIISCCCLLAEEEKEEEQEHNINEINLENIKCNINCCIIYKDTVDGKIKSWSRFSKKNHSNKPDIKS
jgi:hypothetical protein